MYGHNLIGIYPSQNEAQRVKDKLIAEGIPPNAVRISNGPNTDTATPVREREEPGFFAWLFGDAPEDDRNCYDNHLRQDRAIVSVHVTDQRLYTEALDIMEECRPISLDDQGDGVAGPQATTPVPPTARAQPPIAGAPRPAPTTASPPRPREEQVIPVVKEELSVGKQATERHTRVRVYTVERPVEQQITLRDERVTVERRPAGNAARPDIPQERIIDVTERHETPVAEKHGRVTEEVVVRKEVTERPETVRGKVQETRVDVEKEPAGISPPKP